MKTNEYRPWQASAEILAKAMEHIKSVAYRVSLRWAFYRLLQDGIYKNKDGYTNFKDITAEARKREYMDWRRDTFSDGTREIIHRGGGYFNGRYWLRSLGEEECILDKWADQDNYVQIWFEARAMSSQFEHYTKHISLCPFGGDAGIDFKERIAKDLKEAFEIYQRPVKILYFGDYDKKGITIPEIAKENIREWSGVEFEFIRCGLNIGDGENLGIPASFEEVEGKHVRKGEDGEDFYQWEAVPDTLAEKIITENVSKYVDLERFKTVEKQEAIETQKFNKRWKEFCDNYDNWTD